jgi:hypothetical protein
MQKPTHALTTLTTLITLPVAGALLLAGCSGGSKPDALNSATPIGPTSTASPTATAPTTSAPKTQDPNSDAALIAAVVAYMEASEKAAVSLKTDELRKTFAEGCIICERDVARVESWAKSGYTRVGGAAGWSTPTMSTRGASGATLIRVMASTKAGTLKDAAGKTVETFRSVSPTEVYFQVRPIKGHAIVIGITS